MKTISKTYSIPFTPQQVYSAWVSPETVVPPATQMDINPVVGGHYRLIMKSREYTGMNEGTFSVVEPGKRVVYSWEWNKDGEVTQIEVNFRSDGTGTAVHILHSGFEKEESVETHDSGWDSYVAGLVAAMERKHSER